MIAPSSKKRRVLVTRPEPSGLVLCQQLEVAGFDALYFPSIVFEAPNHPERVVEQVREMSQWDWLVFISPQAALTTVDLIKATWPTFPHSVKIAAVGVGTASVLKANGLPVTIYPAEEWSSAGLIELPVFQSIKNQKIAIVRGEGGREFLAEQLTARGAIVDAWITYRRSQPKADITHLVSLLRQKAVDVMICTSGEGLENIKNLLQSEWDLLQNVSLIVISPRLVMMATELGWSHVILAKNASHQAVIEALNGMEGVNMSDITQETPVLDEPSQPSQPSQPKKSCCWLSVGALVLAFAVLGAAIVYLNHKNDQLQAGMQANQVTVSSALDKAKSLQAQLDAIDQRTQAIKQTSVEQTQQLSELRNAQSDKKSVWVVAEAQYLTKLANDRLSVGDSIPSVIKLLQSADSALRDMNDTQLMPVRKALATDILALQSVPETDISGLYLRLSALNAEVDSLSLPNHRLTKNTDVQAVPANLSWWRRGLLQSQEMLRHIVIVRYRAGNELPFIAPEAQDFLYQNIHAELNMAAWGLIHKQPAIYSKSLEQAGIWIKRYCLADAPETLALLSNLTVLEKMNIQPELPTLNASLEAFQQYLASTDKPQVASPVASVPVS